MTVSYHVTGSGTNRLKASNNHIRIISGKWRGRKIPFADAPGLRPTGDRIRETLFNWLQNRVAGSTCLDLFAGSGALGLEAASRGAASVVMVEKNPAVADELTRQLLVLEADQVSVEQGTAEAYLDRARRLRRSDKLKPFDIVFVDPPFSMNLQSPVIDQLIDSGLLCDGGVVYVESDSHDQNAGNSEAEESGTGANGQLIRLRSKQAGNVLYELYEFAVGSSHTDR